MSLWRRAAAERKNKRPPLAVFYSVNTTGFVISPRIPQGRERVRGNLCRVPPSRSITRPQATTFAQQKCRTSKKETSFPRLLIRKHEKVSKINVFKGREHGTKSKNLILTGTKGADFHISALFLSPRHRQPPYGFFSYPYLYPPEKCIN